MFTAEDCKRLTGTDTPDYYTTPPDWRLCKNLNPTGPTPCWHPHCDCMWSPAQIAELRKSNPNQMAAELVSVQPMSSKAGTIFKVAHDFNYDSRLRKYVSRRNAVSRLFRQYYWSKFFK